MILEGDGHGLAEHPDDVFDRVRAFVIEHAGDDGANGDGAAEQPS